MGSTSSKGQFSIAMLVYRSVCNLWAIFLLFCIAGADSAYVSEPKKQTVARNFGGREGGKHVQPEEGCGWWVSESLPGTVKVGKTPPYKANINIAI